ncbi:MAG: hypothetical protein WA197_24160 [Candidatus Acidiferrales bacterium]
MLPRFAGHEPTATDKESTMPLGKPRKLKRRSQKLPKVASMSVIKGPGNLSTFRSPLDSAKDKSKQLDVD